MLSAGNDRLSKSPRSSGLCRSSQESDGVLQDSRRGVESAGLLPRALQIAGPALSAPLLPELGASTVQTSSEPPGATWKPALGSHFIFFTIL